MTKTTAAMFKAVRVMNLTVIFMLMLVMNVSATGFGQTKVSLNFKQATITKILTEIEEQTEYRFLYNENLKGIKEKIAISVKNAALKDVLDQLFSNSLLTYIQMENNLVVIRQVENINNPAFVIVSGTVLGDAAIPLGGVSVQVKGTTVGTTTKNDGTFSLDVANTNVTLVFSYVGYATQEVALAGRNNLTITLLPESQSLDAVVVVGYGTQKKRDLTGSITSVDGEELARMPGTNPIGSLQGKVAGLTIANSGRAGASPVVRIRGINSTNTASPVYVVDGILVDDISFLNSADIETIDVLKDPSSIAIYGLRGANGVIAITSKKAARGKTRVTLTSSVGVQKVHNTIAVTDAEGFKKLYDAQLRNINAQPFDYTGYKGNTDWQDEILRTAVMTSHSLGLSNSTDKSTTFFNVGYTNQDGVVGDDNFERFLVRLNQETKITNNIKLGGTFTGYHNINTPQGVNITNALWAAPIVPIQYDANTYYSMPSFQRAQVGNPIASLRRSQGTSIDKEYRILGSIFAEIKFAKYFTWKSTVYGDFRFGNFRGYNALPFNSRDIGENGIADMTVIPTNVNPSVTQSESESQRFQQDHTLNFDKKLAGGHNVNAILGFTTIKNTSSSLSGNRRDTTVNIPNNPDFWYINIANVSNPGGYSGGGNSNALAGAFARVSYSYEGKYLLNATIRKDGSSKFAPGNRWGTFGSVGAGWVVSQEDFFSNTKGINFLKLRGAWGLTGNSNGIPDNLYQPGLTNASTAVFGNNVFTSLQSAYIVDSLIRWETVEGLDLGFDLKALRNRLNFEFTYYNRTTSDILSATDIPNDSRRAFKNLGEITNKGIELALGWNDLVGKEFTYSVSGNFSYNKNIVNSIGDKIDFSLVGNGGVNLTEVGQSIGYFYGYRQTGIYQTTSDVAKLPAFSTSLPGDISFADTNGDGVITPDDRTYLGTPFPVYNFGGNITMGYKGLDLLLELQGVAGNSIYTERRTSNFAILNYETNRLNAWTGPGTSNVEPILNNTRGNNYLFSSYFLEPGDYLRIRTLQLGYNLSKTSVNSLGIQAARFYLSGQNIANFSQVTGYSPEAQIGSILGGGADNGAYPVPAIYTLGLNITF